jgi:hypothetical protein
MRKGMGWLMVFGVIWTALVSVFDGFVLTGVVRQVRAQSFLSTTGRVTHSEVTSHSGRRSRTYGAKIEFDYSVGGDSFHGDRVRYGAMSSSDAAWARAVAAAHPVGSTAKVFYNPADARDALLQPGLEGGDLMLLLFLTPFNGVMLGFWAGAASALRRKFRPRPAGGLRIVNRLRETRVCLSSISPVVAALMGASFCAFLLIFVLAFGFGGFHPSMRVAIGAWGIVLAVGLAAGGWQWRRCYSGILDLVIDELSGRLEVPATCGRKQRESLPLSAVKTVCVETREVVGSKGRRSQRYLPTLRAHKGAGPSFGLMELNDAAQAEQLAAWLRGKLRVAEPKPEEGDSSLAEAR